MIKAIKNFFRTILIMLLILAIAVVGISFLVKKDQEENIIYTFDDSKQNFGGPYASKMKSFDADAIVILGAGINDDGTPMPMLQDRLDVGIRLYEAGICDKILISGDNGTNEHNELKVMLEYLTSKGIPEAKIYIDYAGFSTYDSMYRASSIFRIKKALVVTQKYHLYRALYIGNNIGIDCRGVASDQEHYMGQLFRNVREMLARDKDVFKTMMKIKPTVEGSPIPIYRRSNSF